MSLAGRLYLVTGAASGFGRAIVLHLIDADATVFALDVNEEGLNFLKASRPDADLTVIYQDITDWSGIAESLVDTPSPNGLVNCAGVGGVVSSFLDYKEEEIDATLNVNFKGAVRVTQCVVKKMMEGGISDASIVNISSTTSTQTPPAVMAYAASKAALNAFTRCLAKELGPKGIRVNSINSHVSVETPLGAYAVRKGLFPADPATIPMQRFVELRDVVDTVQFLLSDKSSHINGVILPLDGGASC